MTGPTEPSPPTEPTEPSPPTEPTEPSPPTEPTEPSPRTEPTEPADAADPGDPSRPGRVAGETGPPGVRRRLEHSPADRFRRGGPGDATVAAGGSPTRAIAMGVVGAIIGVVIFLVLAIGFTYTAGLVIVALFTGRFIGLFVRAGAAGTVASPARALLAIVIFLVAISVALLATWLVAGSEGGVLPLGDYLEQAYGTPIVALEFMLGTLMAWWSAR